MPLLYHLRSWSCILLFIAPFITTAQSTLKIGQPAPDITITDWVANVPKDTSLDGKYIVLEFWATWCGPCIAAVPHMNALQEQFPQEELYFLSMTDESVAKIERTIARVDFQSAVVTDQTKGTHIRYGDGKEGLEAYPMTVLISPDGKVQWVGEPKQLDAATLQLFLDNELNGKNAFLKVEKTEEKPRAAAAPATPDPFQQFLQTVKDPTQVYTFQIRQVSKDAPTAGMSMGNKGFIHTPVNLKQLYDKVFKTKVDVVDGLDTLYYSLLYKNSHPGPNSLETLEAQVLESLVLEKSMVQRTVQAYILRVEDASQLKPALEPRFSAQSAADRQLIFSGYSIAKMTAAINALTETNYVYRGQDKDKYDFIIQTDNDEALRESLQSYGFNWEVSKEEVETILLQPKS